MTQLQGEGATSLLYREPQPLCGYVYCPCPNSQQAVQSALGTKDTNKLSFSTERHQIHDDVQGGLLWAKVVETLQKSKRVKKLMEKRMVACPKCQGKVRVSVGVWRLKAEGQAQVNFPIAAVTLGSVICFCKLLLGHISFCLLSIFFCQETLMLPPHD